MNTSSSLPQSNQLKQRVILAVLALVITFSMALQSRADDYYLQPIGSPNIFDGVPVATLTSWAPFVPFMVNYDPARDSHPGTLIQKGGSNHNETDPLLHQMWRLVDGNLDLDGPASLRFWAAMKDFDASGLRGRMKLMLVECDPDGGNCSLIANGFIDSSSWSGGWDQFDVSFGNVTHTVPAGRILGVKSVVMPSTSDTDMMIGYGATGQASKVSVTPANPVSNDVNLQIVKQSNRTWGYVGTSIVYTLQYNCVSTIAGGQNVMITDTLDPFLTVTGLTNSSHIASSNYDPGTNQVTFTFVDPLPAGSTGEVKITAEFIPSVADNYVAPNSAEMMASNGLNQVSNSVDVTAYNSTTSGPTYTKGVRVYKSANSSDLDLPYERIYYDISHGNTGNVGEDVENYVIDDVFPTSMKLWRFNVGEFPGTSQTVDVYYQTNSISSWQLWGQWDTDDDDSYVYPAELGLPGSDYVSALRFDFGTLPGGGGFHPDASGVEPIDLDLELVDPATMVIGDIITNCANLIAAEVAGSDTYDEEDCDDVDVAAPDPDFYLWDWQWNWASSYEPGDAPRIGFTLGVEWDNGIPLVNPIVASLLPPGFSYDGNFSIDGDAYNDAVAATGASYVIDVIDDFAGGNQQLVRMTFSNLTIPALGVEKEMWFGFDMAIDAATPYGSTESEVFGSWESPVDGQGTSWSVTDSLDYDGDGDNLEKVAKDTEWWQVGDPGSGAASIDSVMWVKGELDSAFSKFPDTGLTVPSGQADYELRITNSGGVALRDLTVIEILPHIGDAGVLDLSSRGSEWAPFLVAPVAAPAGIDVFYSTSGNPCRDELTPGLPAGCDPPAWTTAFPADPTTVKSMKFAYQPGRWLMPSEEILIAWPMRAAINAPTNGEIAWSSFGVIAARADDNQQMLPSEPMKVGIGIQPPQPPFYGDTVWFDDNRNGIQDPTEAGLNGVRVELYEDNGDGVADPSVDTMYSFTLTSNDGTNDGKYLFPYLPPGDYFSVFYAPADHLASPSNVGDDLLDSDGEATMLSGSLVTVTAVTTISVNELDMSWDQGFYDQSALPAVWAIANLGGGSVVIGGKFQSSHGLAAGNIAVLGPNGTPSGGFSSGRGSTEWCVHSR